jgi:hypothetical protein
MKEFLKGNYALDARIETGEEVEGDGTEEEFERTALARLGGSICFVRKKGFVWRGEAEERDGARP